MRSLQGQKVQLQTLGSTMYLILLLCGIVFSPKANSLKCNHCKTLDETCGGEERQCSGEFTRCGTTREATYVGNNGSVLFLRGSCVKADDCKDGSFNMGFATYYFTSMCCDTDLCNKAQPHAPNTKTNPNGRKCQSCDRKSNCTGTLNCEGEETFCASLTEDNITVKGCATRSLCVNPSSIITSYPIKCCEGDYCNDGSSTRACLLLLTVMLILLFSFPN